MLEIMEHKKKFGIGCRIEHTSAFVVVSEIQVGREQERLGAIVVVLRDQSRSGETFVLPIQELPRRHIYVLIQLMNSQAAQNAQSRPKSSPVASKFV